MTSSALRQIEKHPHSWTFTSTYPPPPLDIARVTSSTFQGGWGDRSRSRILCIGFQYRDKFKGGVITPVTPPPPGSATGVHLRSTSKRGGGPRGGPALGPMLKAYIVAQKGGGVRTPWTPPPPGSATGHGLNCLSY